MRDVGNGDRTAETSSVPVPGNCGARSAADRRVIGRRMTYTPPALFALDLRMTQGDTGARVDGALGAYFTSGGGPA